MSIRDKLEPKNRKEPEAVSEVAESYAVAALMVGAICGVYFIVPKPSDTLTALTVLNAFLFLCLLGSLAWIGHFALGLMKDPSHYENIDPPDPLNVHRARLKLERMLSRFQKKK